MLGSFVPVDQFIFISLYFLFHIYLSIYCTHLYGFEYNLILINWLFLFNKNHVLVHIYMVVLVSELGFYGISPFVGYLTPNLFLCK